MVNFNTYACCFKAFESRSMVITLSLRLNSFSMKKTKKIIVTYTLVSLICVLSDCWGYSDTVIRFKTRSSHR